MNEASSSSSLLRELQASLSLGELGDRMVCKLLNHTSLYFSMYPSSCERLVSPYLPEPGSLLLLAVLMLLYLALYWWQAVGTPQVVCADEGRLASLKTHCPVFFQPFRPTVWAWQAHMQTIVRVVVQRFPRSQGRREVLLLADGGHLCLDWYNESSSDQPTVLMLPGITGSSDENYIGFWIRDMTRLGYRSVIFNYRGCGNTKLSTAKLYCGVDTGDLTDIMEHLKMVIPGAPLLGVGASLGSMLLVKYLDECDLRCERSPFQAAMLVSVTWDMHATSQVINRPVNRYTVNRHLCNNFKGIIRENQAVFEESHKRGELCFDYKKALKCRVLGDFNELMVLPMFGYSSMEHVFKDGSPHLRVQSVTTPILALNAQDDPFCPAHTIPVSTALGNRNLLLVTTKRGGHIGFMDGLIPTGRTLMDRALEQFASAVFEHGIFSS